MVTSTSAVLRDERLHSLPYGAIATCLLLPLLGLRRVRRSIPKGLLYLLLLAGALGATTMLTGCGDGGGGFGVQPKNYTLTVIGTSGSLQHSTSLTLVVR